MLEKIILETATTAVADDISILEMLLNIFEVCPIDDHLTMGLIAMDSILINE